LIFTETALPGAYLIELTEHHDDRGLFARTYCEESFQQHSLEKCSSQCNTSFNIKKGTLRGLHFQLNPYQEAKLVRCVSGSIFDVIVDLRTDSPTAGQHATFELSSTNRKSLYIPQGFAHGFITLEHSTEIFYQMSAPYVADSASGIHYKSSSLGIDWPLQPTVISERDRTLSEYDSKQHNL